MLATQGMAMYVLQRLPSSMHGRPLGIVFTLHNTFLILSTPPAPRPLLGDSTSSVSQQLSDCHNQMSLLVSGMGAAFKGIKHLTLDVRAGRPVSASHGTSKTRQAAVQVTFQASISTSNHMPEASPATAPVN